MIIYYALKETKLIYEKQKIFLLIVSKLIYFHGENGM